MAIQEWSNEKLQSIVAEADTYWEEYRFSKKAAGLLAFAHLMKPQECAVALRLAAVMGMKGRNEEAVRLGDFALKHLSDPYTLESPAIRPYLLALSNSYLESGNHRTALKLATLAKSEGHIKAASLAQAKYRHPRPFHFPRGLIADHLRNTFECKILTESYAGFANVNQFPTIYDNDVLYTDIGWVRTEEDLQELTPDKLGVLLGVKTFVCSSEYLRERTLARLPFLGEDNVKVILETPLPCQMEMSSDLGIAVVYRGDERGFSLVEEAFKGKGMKIFREPERHHHAYPSIFILHSEKPSLFDLNALIIAQSNGAIPVCTATGAVPEYMVGGILIKPRLEISPIFDHEHRKALCDAAVRQVSATLAERQHIADEAWKHFSAEKGAMRWLELINHTLEEST